MSLPYFSLNTREALSSTASLYTCDGCSEYIPAAKARLDCDNCVPKHDTCANCYVVGNYTKGHVEGHTSSLIVQSGFRPQPPPMPPRGQDAGGSRQQNQETYGQQNMNVKQQQQQQQQQRQYPQSVAPVQQNQQSQYAQSPAPVQQYQQSKQGYGQQQVYGQQHVPAHQYTPTQQYAPVRQQVVPLPQASPSAPRTPTQGTSQPSPSGWQPLFSGSAPTATYTAFLQAVFARLDTDKDGLISPEQYSAFLDVQQYRLEEDVWKKNHKDLPGYTADDCADYELTTTYENFSIRHEMRPRPNTKAAPHVLEGVYSSIAGLDAKFAQLMKDATPNKSFSNGMMPMLTLPGFIDITVIETLYEPNPGWIRMNRVVQYYQIWREWGDIPRAMLPQGPPKDLVDRVALITQQSQARARGRIEAARVKASIEQQGQEAALRLFDPPGTRYYYT